MITGTKVLGGRVVDRSREGSGIAVIGKIKCGEKAIGSNGKEYSRSLDYFIAKGSYCTHFNDAYPTAPNKIELIFTSDDINYSCPERYELRDKKGHLFGRGNGESFEVWSGKEEKYVLIHLADMPDVKEVSAKKAESLKGWERVLTLRFILPKIRGIMGAWEFSTKADKGSIDSIRDTFDMVQQQAGTVQRIPFDLTIEKHTSQKPDSKSSYPIIRLIPNISDQNMMLVSKFLNNGGSLKGIPAITDAVAETLLLAETTELEFTTNQTEGSEENES